MRLSPLEKLTKFDNLLAFFNFRTKKTKFSHKKWSNFWDVRFRRTGNKMYGYSSIRPGVRFGRLSETRPTFRPK